MKAQAEPTTHITKEEFEAEYATQSGVTIEWLHQHRRRAVPCDCGDELYCRGWQMIHEC